MKVILYMAISTDGFIATTGGDSEWVSEVDVEIFNKKIKDFGIIVMGNKTFQQFRGEYFPKKDAINIIVSKTRDNNPEDNVIFVKSPKDAVKEAKSRGFEKVLLIGGGKTNAGFLKENLIDEIYLDVHPLILGDGIKLFDGLETNLRIEKIESTDLGLGQTLLHYKIIK
jgi:dihydrofolate reductase